MKPRRAPAELGVDPGRGPGVVRPHRVEGELTGVVTPQLVRQAGRDGEAQDYGLRDHANYDGGLGLLALSHPGVVEDLLQVHPLRHVHLDTSPN